MQILQQAISISELKELAQNTFGDMIKCVADVKRGLLAVDADLHADLERLLLEDGSAQESLWGFNLWVEEEGEDAPGREILPGMCRILKSARPSKLL